MQALKKKKVVMADLSGDDGPMLQFVSEELKADKDVVMAAVTSNGRTKSIKRSNGEALEYH